MSACKAQQSSKPHNGQQNGEVPLAKHISLNVLSWTETSIPGLYRRQGHYHLLPSVTLAPGKQKTAARFCVASAQALYGTGAYVPSGSCLSTEQPSFWEIPWLPASRLVPTSKPGSHLVPAYLTRFTLHSMPKGSRASCTFPYPAWMQEVRGLTSKSGAS